MIDDYNVKIYKLLGVRQRTRQLSCLRLQARGFVVECINSPDPGNSATFVLPFLQVFNNLKQII